MNHDTSFFLSLSLSFISLSHSLCLGNGLTLHRWHSDGTSSEVLMGHMHDDQVNKQAGLRGGDRESWSKVGITGKSQSSVHSYWSSCWMITAEIGIDLHLVHSSPSSTGDKGLLSEYSAVLPPCYPAFFRFGYDLIYLHYLQYNICNLWQIFTQFENCSKR